jgi:hypothetical protein
MTQSTILQKAYIQKSKLFLLPLTGLKKSKAFKVGNTYIESNSLISEEYPSGISKQSSILIVSFPKSYRDESIKLQRRLEEKGYLNPEEMAMTEWEKYETEIMSNEFFIAFHEADNELIYTFDLSKFARDFLFFLKGKYSMISEDSKLKILKYRLNDLKLEAKEKIVVYLYPNKRELLLKFARDLGVSVEDLMEVGELCDKPNFELEKYNCSLCPSEYENKS